MANRHGLITGATGSGKTVTLRVIAENFSKLGVPVFMADVKGDLSGIIKPGGNNNKIKDRVELLGLKNFSYSGYPTLFFDLYGEYGHPIQTTCTQLGSLLLSRLMDLNRVQTGIMTLMYRINKDNDKYCMNLLDVKMMLRYVADNSYEFKTQYGNITYSSVWAIQREILCLQEQGVDLFFNEPIFDISHFFHQDDRNYGCINILQADTLIKAPKLYTTFLLWLLSELYEKLPEVGDLDKPKFVFFFDEAHLLFKDIPKILLEKLEQIVKLIRSKGVGVYFITQTALDIPRGVLGQLGNRVQHALRAFTPEDEKAVVKIAKTFRRNRNFDTAEAIMELKVGEALVSFLQEDGDPAPVERVLILPPESDLTPLSKGEISEVVHNSPIYGIYDHRIIEEEPKVLLEEGGSKDGNKLFHDLGRGLVRGLGSRVGNQILRGVFNTFFSGFRGGLGK